MAKQETKKPKQTKNEFLHDYLFHYNPYTKLFAAFKRSDMVDYFNGSKKSTIIKMKSADDLVEYLKENKE